MKQASIKIGESDEWQCEDTATFLERALGLIRYKEYPKGKVMRFFKCGSVHTFFMRFDIDVIYLDRDNQVVKVVRGLKPWRLSLGGVKAVTTLEVSAGWLPEINLGTKIR